MRYLTLLFLFTPMSFFSTPVQAADWSGALVDSGCYAAWQRNTGTKDTMIWIDRDFNEPIAYCSPGAKTKSFALVLHDNQSLPLDPAGNTKAANLVRTSGPRQRRFDVAISGELAGDTLKVDAISALKLAF